MPSEFSPATDAVNSGTNIVNIVGNPYTAQEDEQDKMFVFNDARPHLQRLIDDWKEEIEDSEIRRKTRKMEVDVEGLRQKGDLDEDETYIPIRVIDSNIAREQPPYVNYLKNSRRIAIFECLSNPNTDTDLIEQDFTRKASYTGWELAPFKCLDGSNLHGWDAVEVVLDESKPGHFALEHIGHDRLIFPRSALDLQECPRICRSYDVTLTRLKNWVTSYGFNEVQIDKLRAARKETKKENETIRIYKMYLKKDGSVYVGWFSLENGVDDWLSVPVPFYCGIDEYVQSSTLDPFASPISSWQPKQMTLYPIFILPYRVSEEAKIIDNKGRGFLDEFKQEAQTALWSAFINGMNRASQVYASPSQEDGTGASLKELENLVLRGGRFMNKPINFWHMDYPDPVVLRTLQYADVSNSEETNQVNFAAMNREDSRKTAKEIGAAQQQQVLLNSVQLTLFSTFIREVYSFAWLIVQSQALQNKISFLQKEVQQPQTNPITGQPVIDPQTGQPVTQTVFLNDTETIGYKYTIRAAGDVDVIQKDELLNKMRQDWGVISQTALRDQFLTDYIKLSYPDKADRYAQVLAQSGQMQQLKGLVGRLSTMLNGALKDAPQVMDQLPQQSKADLVQTLQEAQQVNPQAPQS